MKSQQRDFWTGVFVIGGLLTLAGAYAVSFVDRVAQETVAYTIDATEITGVQVGTAVTMGGYPLGRITRVEVTTSPRLAFVLEAGLRPDVPLPAGTRALLAAKLAGGAEIELRPPEGSGGELPNLAPGAHLVLENQTDVQDMIDHADAVLRDLEVVAREARSASEDPTVGLHATLGHLDRVLGDAERTLAASTGAAKRVDTLVARADPKLDRSLTQLESTLAESERAVREMEKVLANADARLDELKGVDAVIASYDAQKNEDLRASLRHLKELTASLARVAAALEKAPLRTLRHGTDGVEGASAKERSDAD